MQFKHHLLCEALSSIPPNSRLLPILSRDSEPCSSLNLLVSLSLPNGCKLLQSRALAGSCRNRASDKHVSKELASQQEDHVVHFNCPFSASLSGSGLSWLYLGGEHGGTGPDAPANHGLGDAAFLDAPADLIFLSAPYLPGTREQGKGHRLTEPPSTPGYS